MSTENEDEKIAFDKEIKELMRLAFDKAQKDSRETSKSGKSKHIETEINSQISQRNLLRYYNQYILSIDEGIQPNTSSLNIISKYLEFESFADYCHKTFPIVEIEEAKEDVEIPEINSKDFIKPKRKLHKLIYGLGITSVLSVGSYYGIGAANRPQCMYWNENHYETIHCDEDLRPNIAVIPVDEQMLKHFKKIEVSDTTTFFEAGKPVVWYRKVDGEIEFYSAPGNHPINGEELRKVSIYIIEKYVFNK